MKPAYVYLQLYKLFDTVTPIKADCGMLCGKACCKGDDCGMFLFPGEEEVYKLLKPSWLSVQYSDFTYSFNGKEYKTPIAMCKGACDRFERPLACRIFPLTPYIDNNDRLTVITDPRAKGICRLAKGLKLDEFDPLFLKNIKRTFLLLDKNKKIHAYLKEYSRYLDEFARFF